MKNSVIWSAARTVLLLRSEHAGRIMQSSYYTSKVLQIEHPRSLPFHLKNIGLSHLSQLDSNRTTCAQPEALSAIFSHALHTVDTTMSCFSSAIVIRHLRLCRRTKRLPLRHYCCRPLIFQRNKPSQNRQPQHLIWGRRPVIHFYAFLLKNRPPTNKSR